MAALSLATDLGIGVPLEHGLQSTLVAMRLAERLGVDSGTASQTYYACLLFYVGCTADAEVAAETFGDDDALTTHALPARFGSKPEMMAGIMRALASSGSLAPVRAMQMVRGMPRAAREFKGHVTAFCEVAQMLTDRLGLPASMQGLFAIPGRALGRQGPAWSGQARADPAAGADRLGGPRRRVPAHAGRRGVRRRGGPQAGGRRVRPGGGHPARRRGRGAPGARRHAFVWEETLACEPGPQLTLEGEAIDRALGAMGDFADLASPYLVGHSAGVAELATAAAQQCRLEAADLVKIRRGALVHDLGRVAVPVRIWQKAAPLTPDDWERVRLHAYHSERVLTRSPFLAALAPVASFHHERLDGSGYHRGTAAAALTPPARLLAAADAYHAMTEPRPHRAALSPGQAAEALGREAAAGRLDPDAVTAVLEVAGQRVPRIERPAGLTEREAEVIGLLARGLQTKQVARRLGISVKTADHHIQNAYAKIGVSTRAAAALFAMQHGLTAWGELPIGRTRDRS